MQRQHCPRRFGVVVGMSDFESCDPVPVQPLPSTFLLVPQARYFSEILLPAYTGMNEHIGTNLCGLWQQLKIAPRLE